MSGRQHPFRRAVGLLVAAFCLAGPTLRSQSLQDVRTASDPILWKTIDLGQSSKLSWDYRTAAHLLRRAGFSAPPDELDRIVAQGFEATLNELLNVESVDDSVMERRLEDQNYPLVRLTNQGQKRAHVANLQRWWLYRMTHTRRPLLEKMVYFWHDHFATSVQVANQVDYLDQPLIWVQNQTFRQHALGNFKDLVRAMAQDPAMLLWLDNVSNVAGRPNENWARELMELFTMGIGHYTEEDVKEAARAFTGWGLNRRFLTFQFYSNRHDHGEKLFLGRTGKLGGYDIINIIFEQDQTARFLAAKLFEFFVYEEPSAEIIDELAAVFRGSGYDIRALLRAIFEHPEFFTDRAYRSQIKSPVELAVGTYRTLEVPDPGQSLRLLSLMGQELFNPPDVGGWPSGPGWLNTSTLLARYNFLNYVITRREGRGQIPLSTLLREQAFKSSGDTTAYFARAIVQDDISLDTRYALERYLWMDDQGNMMQELNLQDPIVVDKKIRGLIYLIAVLPVNQLN